MPRGVRRRAERNFCKDASRPFPTASVLLCGVRTRALCSSLVHCASVVRLARALCCVLPLLDTGNTGVLAAGTTSLAPEVKPFLAPYINPILHPPPLPVDHADCRSFIMVTKREKRPTIKGKQGLSSLCRD